MPEYGSKDKLPVCCYGSTSSWNSYEFTINIRVCDCLYAELVLIPLPPSTAFRKNMWSPLT